MGNWRDQAEEAEPAPAKHGNWMDLAEEADSIPVSKEPGDLLPPAEQKTEAPGFLSNLVHQGLQGASKYGSDEMMGKFASDMTDMSAPNHPFAYEEKGKKPVFLKTQEDVHRAVRNSERDALDAGAEAWPKSTVAANIAGDVISDFVISRLGIPVTSSIYQTAVGTLSGLLNSKEELTSEKRTPESIRGATQDAMLGGVASYAIPKVGGALVNKVIGKPAGWLANASRNAAADAGQQSAKLATGLVREEAGRLGGHSSSGNRAMEVLDEIINGPHSTPEQKAKALEFLNGPDGLALKRAIYDSTLDRAPHALGNINASHEALQLAKQGTTKEALNAATDERLSHPIRPIARFVQKYGSRVLPSFFAAHATDGLGGGAAGTAAGAVVGAGVGASIGKPGTALENVINDPALRKFAADTAGSAVSGIGRYAPVLARALATGGPELAKIYEWVLSKDPELAAQFQKALEPSQETP